MTIRLAILLSHPIPQFAVLHRELAKNPEIELRVFFCCDWGLNGYHDPLFQTEVRWDVPLIEGYDHEFLPIHARPDRLSFWEVDNPGISDSLKEFAPDVVQLNGYAHRTNWRVARWARQNGKPLMMFSDSNANGSRRGWKQTIKRPVVRYFYRHVDGAMYVGDNNLAYHRRFGMPSDRLFPMGFPIDQDLLLRSVPDIAGTRRKLRNELGIPEEAFVVLFCGKLAPHKRPLDLARAGHWAAQKGLPVWCILVGEGPSRPELEKYIQDHNVQNVRLTGFINQSIIAEYYAAADCLALTSEHEPFGLVVVEAASFGLPVIITNAVGCIGPSSTARRDINALVYTPGDQQALQSAIERLAGDQSLCRRMSDASRTLSLAHSATNAARDLASAINRLHQLGTR